MDDIEKIKLHEFEDQFGAEIENWRRWGRVKDYLPMSWGSIIGGRYRPRNREIDREEAKRPIDTQNAFKFERIVCEIPDMFRQAFVLHYVGRVSVNGRVRVARTKEDGARIIGVKRAQYYNRVNKAAVIILRNW